LLSPFLIGTAVLFLDMKKALFISLLLFSSFKIFALTWDEPWHDKVVKESDYFILARVINYDTANGILVDVIKSIGGKEIKGQIIINDFYLLKICSYSGGQRYPKVRLNNVDSCFFFLKLSNDTFSIATPTTGYAEVIDGKVRATYRHSYHQASVPFDVYWKSQSAIFNFYHELPYNKSEIVRFVSSKISQKPAGFSDAEIDLFFEQHVALELIFHLQLDGLYDKIILFLNHKKNKHNQISAARALISYDSKEKNAALLKLIKEENDEDFLKVICVWSLRNIAKYDQVDEIKNLLKTASEEPNGFGGNIMDNRVCTTLPKVKNALQEALDKIN
jgi:hypothetical protein